MFQVHLKPLTLEGDAEMYASRLAALTPGFAGAEISNTCNEAAIVAARDRKDKVGCRIIYMLWSFMNASCGVLLCNCDSFTHCVGSTRGCGMF